MKNINVRKIRDTQILKVTDAATILGISEKRVRILIKDGLKLLYRSPSLILGLDMKIFLKELNRRSRQHVGEYNAFYCSCCKKTVIIDLKDITEKKTGKSYRDKAQITLSAKCPRCGKRMVKLHIQEPVHGEINRITTTTTEETTKLKKRNIKKVVIRPAGENAKILYRFYYKYCLHIKGYSTATLSKIEKAVSHFTTSSNNCDFKSVTIDTVIAFKVYLKGLTYNGRAVSLSSISEYLHYTQLLFIYLIDRPGFRQRINIEIIECFNLSIKERNSLKSGKDRSVNYPSFDEILEIVNSIDPSNIVKRSKRAMIALIALSGVRRASCAKLRMYDWDLDNSRLTITFEYNDPKNGNYIETTIAPLDEQLCKIFTEYHAELVSLGYQDHNPIFPKAKPRREGNDLCPVESTELSMDFMSKYNVSRIVKEICIEAGYPKYSIHKFRHSYSRAMKQRIPQMDLMTALMKNMGHKTINLSAFHYGAMSREEQHKIILDHFSKNPDEIPSNVDPKIWNKFLEFRKYVEYNESQKKK